MARATVSPPTPESKIPMGASVTCGAYADQRRHKERYGVTCHQRDTLSRVAIVTLSNAALHPRRCLPILSSRRPVDSYRQQPIGDPMASETYTPPPVTQQRRSTSAT